MKKQLNLLSSSILILGILIACKKDKVLEPVDIGSSSPVVECTDIIFAGGEVFDNWINTGEQYSAPIFSPFTDDEFLFIRWNSSSERQLVKYSIQTMSEQVLCSTSDVGGYHISSQVDWSDNNWIVFSVGTGSSGICFKIRDDGTALEQITPNNLSRTYPKFNSTGNQFITMGTPLTSSGTAYRPILDLAGLLVDSIPIYYDGILIGSPYYFESDFSSGFFYYADQNQFPTLKGVGYLEGGSVINSFFTDSFDGEILKIEKSNGKIYFLVNLLGLYSFDTQTSEIAIHQQICDTRHIKSFSVSKNTGNVLIEEVKRSKVDEFGGVDEQSNIYLLNPSTGEKTPILVE